MQLESLVGNSTNPDTYRFPVRFCRIAGANVETVLENPSREVLSGMIAESRRLVSEGVRAITTSCGFNAVFQRELADALSDLPVQVFTSSLLLVPLAMRFMSERKKIGIITAKRAALKEGHFRASGFAATDRILVFGLEKCPEWNKIFSAPNEDIDIGVVRAEILGTAKEAVRDNPEIGAIVLECTDLPPFADGIRSATRLPVYDFTTIVGLVASSLGLVGLFGADVTVGLR
jgi:hypothetical protein